MSTASIETAFAASSMTNDDDDDRWAAVVRRDPTVDGLFYVCVRTTGIYCRPTCKARLPKRENIRFHPTRADAEAAGFRACKRCRPNEMSAAR